MIRRLQRRTLCCAVLAGAFLCLPAAAAGEPLNGLQIQGGEDAWHRDSTFGLTWQLGGPPYPDAVHFLVRDAAGEVVIPEVPFPSALAGGGQVVVPAVPGRYTAEIWALNGTTAGEHHAVTLLFDNARPGPVRVQEPSGWFGGELRPTLRIEGPSTAPPLSGIRGFALSVDRFASSSPCAGNEFCSEAEIDLDAGGAEGPIELGALPEGVNFAHLVAVSGSGMRSAEVATAELHVDRTRPDVSLAGLPDGWADGPVRLVATASDPLSGMAPAGPGGPFTALAIDGGPPLVAAGSSVAATVSGDGLHRVTFYGRDAAGNIGDGSAGSSPPGSAQLLIDGSPPQVSFNPVRDPAEPERLEALVRDPLSGPSAELGSIGVRPAGTRQRFVPLETSVSAGRLIAHWDSDSYPVGTYEFSATGYDAAGNRAAGDRRSDGARMVLANPLKMPVELHLELGGKRRQRERFGARVAVAGRLRSAAGAPLGGRRVELVESFGTGSESARRTTAVLTAADGSFEARLLPGPSRTVEGRFGGSPVLGRAATDPLALNVPAAVRFRASAPRARVGGPSVVFRGKVAALGARIPRSGLPVELQFRVGGLPWSEFRTVQTDRRGRFRYAYAFSDDDSRGARFRFRAVVPKAEDWPYEEGASRAVTVTGR